MSSLIEMDRMLEKTGQANFRKTYLEAEIASLDSIIATYTELMLPDSKTSLIFGFLDSTATLSNLQLVELRPGAAQANGEIIILPVFMKIYASLFDLMTYLEFLESSGQVYGITALRITTQKNGSGKLLIRLEINCYLRKDQNG